MTHLDEKSNSYIDRLVFYSQHVKDTLLGLDSAKLIM